MRAGVMGIRIASDEQFVMRLWRAVLRLKLQERLGYSLIGCHQTFFVLNVVLNLYT